MNMKKQILIPALLFALSSCSQGNWGWQKDGNQAATPSFNQTQPKAKRTQTPKLKKPDENVISAPSADFTGHYKGTYFVNGQAKDNGPGSGVPIFEHPAKEHQRSLRKKSKCRFTWQCS